MKVRWVWLSAQDPPHHGHMWSLACEVLLAWTHIQGCRPHPIKGLSRQGAGCKQDQGLGRRGAEIWVPISTPYPERGRGWGRLTGR